MDAGAVVLEIPGLVATFKSRFRHTHTLTHTRTSTPRQLSVTQKVSWHQEEQLSLSDATVYGKLLS